MKEDVLVGSWQSQIGYTDRGRISAFYIFCIIELARFNFIYYFGELIILRNIKKVKNLYIHCKMWLFEYSEGFLKTIPEKQYHHHSII